MATKVQRALLSVSDKRGLVPFARALADLGIELLSTGGTQRALVEAGLSVKEVSAHTGFPEMMDGRVKTLHPKIHGGLLALRDEPSHRVAMAEHGIAAIDLVVVNLYPFEATIEKPGVSRAEAIEQIDIGGPSMLRSAAKNHRYVGVVSDPADYGRVLEDLAKNKGALSDELRRDLAVRAFENTARYDAAIAAWLFAREREAGQAEPFPGGFALAGTQQMRLRYGENPHQEAALYRASGSIAGTLVGADVLSGKALSYNNYVDLDAALALACEFEEPFACVIKHNNPCGAAAAANLAQALELAWAGDPVSAFGSVLALTRPVDLACASFLASEQRFVEAIVAPSFDPAALELLTTKPKWGKNVRLLALGAIGPKTKARERLELKPVSGGFLLQDQDALGTLPEAVKVVTRVAPSHEQLISLLFAERVAKHVKSNAIVLARGSVVVGVGAGQMSRVDSVRLALEKAGDRRQGAVLASDAFFPFPDGPEIAMQAGVVALLQPGGSVKDQAVIEACNAHGVAMVFTGQRHFRH
jgi:phosphoribosylaminoimidazolecarboxamide formyltransferase / IMP cyclohydrolase